MKYIQFKGIGVYLISLLAILLWSMSYLWSHQVLSLGIPVEYLVFIRMSLAGVLLLAYCLLRDYSIKIQKRDYLKFLLMALCEPFIYFICETHGLRLTDSPTFSALIIATAPIFSVASGVLIFKERINWINIIGIIICLTGIVMVTFGRGKISDTFIWGLILLLVAILSEVGHASCTKSLAGGYRPEVIVMYQFLIGSVMLYPLFHFAGLKDFNADLYLSWDVFKPIIFLAVFCSSIAFSLWVNTIKTLGVAKSSIFLATIPIFTAVNAWLIAKLDSPLMQDIKIWLFGLEDSSKDSLNELQWLGILVACVGVVLSQFVFKKNLNKS